MLTSLSIKNYALIDHLHVDFNNGFTIITGETGAGKSILLGGLSLILGKRADLSSLRDKESKCIIEANFDITNYNLESLFIAEDLDFEAPLKGSLFSQFESVAKMIELGAKGAFESGVHQRQIFFVSLGGFDTHNQQLANHPKLLRELSLGLWKFQTALHQWHCFQLVDVMTDTCTPFSTYPGKAHPV